MPGILQQDVYRGQTCRDMENLQASHESYFACRTVQTDLPNIVAGLNLCRGGWEWLKTLSAQVCAGFKKKKKFHTDL